MVLFFALTSLGVLSVFLAGRALYRGRHRRVALALAALDLQAARARPLAGHQRPRRPAADLPFPFAYLNRRLRLGGVTLSLQGVLALAAMGAVVCWAVATMLFGPGWLPTVALAGGLYAPVLWVQRQAGRRREAIAAEMERGTAALRDAVQAGMVPYEAILEVGVSAGGLLGPELLRVAEDADRVGLSEALVLFGQRLPLPEVGLLVAGMRLNQGAGAELGASLDGLHRTLRERREMAAVLRSATAAGRWQTNMLVAIPPLLLLLLRAIYPAFEAPLLGTAAGHILLAFACLWVAIGYLVVRRMSTPREMI